MYMDSSSPANSLSPGGLLPNFYQANDLINVLRRSVKSAHSKQSFADESSDLLGSATSRHCEERSDDAISTQITMLS
jgi:hypothetical protein